MGAGAGLVCVRSCGWVYGCVCGCACGYVFV